jgi:hypothetical protein
MQLSEEKIALRQMAADFLAEECPLSLAREHDEAETFPTDLYEKLGHLGWQGIPFPEKYGGSEGDMIDVALVIEQMGRAMGPLASAYLISVLTCGLTLLDLGTPDQIDRWLRPVIEGRSMLAFSLTEPNAGSDAAAITARAKQTDNGWLLSGQKMFCTGAPLADALLVAAKTGSGPAKNSSTRTPKVCRSTQSPCSAYSRFPRVPCSSTTSNFPGKRFWANRTGPGGTSRPPSTGSVSGWPRCVREWPRPHWTSPFPTSSSDSSLGYRSRPFRRFGTTSPGWRPLLTQHDC